MTELEYKQVVLDLLADLKASNATVYFVPNSGNAGDCLINTATYQVLDSSGLDYVEIDNREVNAVQLTGKVILLGGGGGFIGNYTHMQELVTKLAPVAAQLVVLPQTIRGHQQLIHELPATVTLIVREQESYDYVLSCQTQARLLLSCDMALHLDIKQLRADSLFSLPLKKIVRFGWSWLKISLIRLHFGSELMAMRIDSEQTDIAIDNNNLDMSELLALGAFNRRYNDFVSYHFLRQIDRFEPVHSNRLHVCIAAMLLNKTTFMYDNNYGKNKSVFQHSLMSHSNIKYSHRSNESKAGFVL